jgi:predicted NBD/HSP70 family sugar kinase
MPLMKYYIGLDAHSTTSTFAVVDESGQCVLRETVKTSEQSLVHVINRINGERHIAVVVFAVERQGGQFIDLQPYVRSKKARC